VLRACARLAPGFVLLVALASPAWAGPATEQLKTQIDRVLAKLHDPAARGPAHRAERQAFVREAMDATIDFTEVSRRALGAAWAARTPAERQEFVTVFSDFLKRSYLGRIDLYDKEKLIYNSESVEGDLATVSTTLEWKDGDTMSLGFKLKRDAAERWKIYDVALDGVHLIDSYRAQFTSLLRRNSFADLLTRIKSLGTAPK
jgi:phospholipid transport system substrate-binding protein